MVGLDRTLQMGSAKPGSRKRGLDRAWIAGGSRMDRARETGAPTPVLLQLGSFARKFDRRAARPHGSQGFTLVEFGFGARPQNVRMWVSDVCFCYFCSFLGRQAF